MKRQTLLLAVLVVVVVLVVVRPDLWNMVVVTMESKKEGFVNKKCPDNTRSDGPCLMEF